MHYIGYGARKDPKTKTYMGYLTYINADGERQEYGKPLDAATRRAALKETDKWRTVEERSYQESVRQTLSIQLEADTAKYVSHYVDLIECGLYSSYDRYPYSYPDEAIAKRYRLCCKVISQHYKGRPINGITSRSICQWEGALSKKGYSSDAIDDIHDLLHEALRYAVRTGALARDPMNSILRLHLKHSPIAYGYAYIHNHTATWQERRAFEGISEANRYADTAGSGNSGRPKLEALLSELERGDTIRISSFEDLADSPRQLMELVKRLDSMGVDLISQPEGIRISEPFGIVWPKLFDALESMDTKAAAAAGQTQE